MLSSAAGREVTGDRALKGLNSVPRHRSAASLDNHQTVCFPFTCWYLPPPLPVWLSRDNSCYEKDLSKVDWSVPEYMPNFLLRRIKKGNKLYLSTEPCRDTRRDQKNPSHCCISECDGLASRLGSLQMHFLGTSQFESFVGFSFLLICYIAVISIYYICVLWQARILKND